jgi:hypothetical protein
MVAFQSGLTGMTFSALSPYTPDCGSSHLIRRSNRFKTCIACPASSANWRWRQQFRHRHRSPSIAKVELPSSDPAIRSPRACRLSTLLPKPFDTLRQVHLPGAAKPRWRRYTGHEKGSAGFPGSDTNFSPALPARRRPRGSLCGFVFPDQDFFGVGSHWCLPSAHGDLCATMRFGSLFRPF